MFDTRLPDMSNNYKKFDLDKIKNYIDFKNYRRKDIHYSFNEELQNLKNQLQKANEYIAELKEELKEIKTEFKTIQALKEE